MSRRLEFNQFIISQICSRNIKSWSSQACYYGCQWPWWEIRLFNCLKIPTKPTTNLSICMIFSKFSSFYHLLALIYVHFLWKQLQPEEMKKLQETLEIIYLALWSSSWTFFGFSIFYKWKFRPSFNFLL